MLIFQHQSGLGAPVDLATCAKEPTRCDPQRLAEILDGLECGCPPDATAINLLAQGMAAGDPIAGTNPFFANAGVMRALRANAPANPDVAILTAIKAIDDLLQSGNNAVIEKADITDTSGQFTNGFFAEAINVIAASIPAAQPDQQARGILKLKDLTGITTLLNIANNARNALGSITLPKPLPSVPPSAPPTSAIARTPFVLSPNAKVALTAVAAVLVLGGGAFAVWRLGAHPGRLAPAMGRRRRAR
jgi:hypothetical protein